MNTDYQNSKQYLRYMHELEHTLNVLDNETKSDILNELASHIYESMCMMPNTTLPEEERLSKVLNKLGNPTKIAQSYISEAQLKKVLIKGNPFQIVKYAGICMLRTGKYLISGVLYLFGITFLILSILKVFIPDHIGFFHNQEQFFIGYTSETDASMNDMLGYWFIPISLIFSGILYVTGTILIKRDISKKQR